MNTVDGRSSPHPVEWLKTYEDLARWSRRVGILTDEQLARLLVLCKQHAEEAQRVLIHALQWRESLYRLLRAIADREAVAEADLAQLNQEYMAALTQQQIVPTHEGFALIWPDAGSALAFPLWQLAKSAGEIVTTEAVKRVRLCAGLECSWLFFDQSKNHSRKWCDSQDCGNRDRVRRYYHQSRARAREASPGMHDKNASA